MRFWGLALGVLLVTAALAMMGCNQSKQPANVASTGNKPQANAQGDNVRRVTITELRDELDKGTAVVVDVRGDEAYKQEHIKGALDIPETQLMSRLGELPKDKLIVFYCS